MELSFHTNVIGFTTYSADANLQSKHDHFNIAHAEIFSCGKKQLIFYQVHN